MGFATHLLYDPKGNMTNNGAGQVYAWDFNNRMETATVSGGAASTYAYDALGRRVSKAVGSATATVYVSDGDQEIAEYPLSGVAASPQMKYVYGQYIDEPVMMVNSSGTYYYHQNNLYSVSALTDSNGALQECYAYTPYGQVTFFGSNGVALSPQPSSSPLGNPFLFTGRRLDPETGLQYNRARYYSNSLGRFLSRDPIESSVNLYEYCDDNPAVYVDPDGLCGDGNSNVKTCCCCADGIKIQNIIRIDTATHMGHSFDTVIDLSYVLAKQSSDCTFEWWEKTNVPAVAGHPANQWTEMYGLMQGDSFDSWNSRTKPCPGKETVVDTDPARLARLPGRTVTRTLEIKVVVKSSPGCPCASASQTVTAKQVLVMVNGNPDWKGSSFTTP